MNKKLIIGLVILITIIMSSIAVISAAEPKNVTNNVNDEVKEISWTGTGTKNAYWFTKEAGLEEYYFHYNRTLGKYDVKEYHLNRDTIDDPINDGLWTYDHLEKNNVTINVETDKITASEKTNFVAIYNFTPYMYTEFIIIDLHGHSSGYAAPEKMIPTGTNSQTHTFLNFTDPETGYKPLYILDLDTNNRYKPGDNFTVTYQDVANTGMKKIIKTFQYIYAKDIVIENIIIENRTIYNDTIINRDIFNDTIIDRIIYNDTIINREIFNDTIINREIFNDTIINREIFNDTIIDRIIYNDTIINRDVFNDTIINRIIYNDTIINRDIFNDTIIDRIIYNDTIINRTIFNDTIVNRTIENITYVNKIIENITYVNKTIEIPKYVIKIIEIQKYVTKIVEIPEVEKKTIIKNETKDIENVTKEIKVKEEIKNVPKIVPIKEVINEPVKQVVNNQNVTKNNATKIIKVLNNNITKTNTTTNNINNENNTSTPTSNNIKTIKMKETGNTIAWIILFIFIIALATFIYQDKD